MNLDLSNTEIERYSRNLILKGWSKQKQLYLKAQELSISSTLASTALILAAVGIGRLNIIPADSQTDSLIDQLKEFNDTIEVSLQAEHKSADFLITDQAGLSSQTKIFVNYPEAKVSLFHQQQLVNESFFPEKIFVKKDLIGGALAASLSVKYLEANYEKG